MKALRLAIPKGDAGADVTARIIRQLIEVGKRDPRVRAHSISILKLSEVPNHDSLGEIRALHRWTQRNVRYVRDPFRIEYIQTPGRMLETLTGDCDDYTAFLGAMLESVGYPVDIKVVARKGRRDFHHVYPVVNIGGVDIGLDASMPVPFGVQASELSRSRTYKSEASFMVGDVYANLAGRLGLAPIIIQPPNGTEPDKPPGTVDIVVEPGGTIIKGTVTPTTGGTVIQPKVGGCYGVRWDTITLKDGQTLTDRCLKERIAGGYIRAAEGCHLTEVLPTATPDVFTVGCMADRPSVPPPIPGMEPRCDWPIGGPSVRVLQIGEVVSGTCVPKFYQDGRYKAAPGGRLEFTAFQTALPNGGGTVRCVADTSIVQPPPTEPGAPGVTDVYAPTTPAPVVVTTPGGAAQVQEAGFPTWAAIAIGAAVLLPMLFGKGR